MKNKLLIPLFDKIIITKAEDRKDINEAVLNYLRASHNPK